VTTVPSGARNWLSMTCEKLVAPGIGPVLGGVDLGRVGGLARLRHSRAEAIAQAPHEKVRPEVGQASSQLLRCLLCLDDHSLRSEHAAGVEAFLDGHDADARLGVASEDRPLDRGGAAPARQQ